MDVCLLKFCFYENMDIIVDVFSVWKQISDCNRLKNILQLCAGENAMETKIADRMTGTAITSFFFGGGTCSSIATGQRDL